jgi:membrane-bound ClpP family serine protease
MVKGMEDVRAKVLQLSPGNDAQRQLQTQATQIMSDLIHARWLVVLQRSSSVSMPLVALLVIWLAVIFAAFGLFSPRNQTVVATLFLSALSVSGAIFLILELNSPLTGFITISNEAMHAAIAHLGQ